VLLRFDPTEPYQSNPFVVRDRAVLSPLTWCESHARAGSQVLVRSSQVLSEGQLTVESTIGYHHNKADCHWLIKIGNHAAPFTGNIDGLTVEG